VVGVGVAVVSVMLQVIHFEFVLLLRSVWGVAGLYMSVLVDGKITVVSLEEEKKSIGVLFALDLENCVGIIFGSLKVDIAVAKPK
jgi:hypothetical protein